MNPYAIERCPECGRPKSRNANDGRLGFCDKWYAVRDPEAQQDCKEYAESSPLIASHKELYEELTLTLGTLKEVCIVRGVPRPTSTIRRAYAVLNKARGEQ